MAITDEGKVFESLVKAHSRKRFKNFLKRKFKRFNNLKVLCLLGPEHLELDIYDDLGIPRENIYCFETSKKFYASLLAKKLGVKLINADVRSFIETSSDKFDIISLDTTCQLDTFIECISKIRFLVNDEAVILTNFLAQRETPFYQRYLALAKNYYFPDEEDGFSLSKDREMITGAVLTRSLAAIPFYGEKIKEVLSEIEIKLNEETRRTFDEISSDIPEFKTGDFVLDNLRLGYIKSFHIIKTFNFLKVLDRKSLKYISANGSPMYLDFFHVQRIVGNLFPEEIPIPKSLTHIHRFFKQVDDINKGIKMQSVYLNSVRENLGSERKKERSGMENVKYKFDKKKKRTSIKIYQT